MQTFRYAFLGLVLAACSNNPGNGDGGTDAGGDVNNANTFNQTGTIVDFSAKTGLEGMIVTGGGATAKTDSTGKYTLAVPKNAPYTMTIASDPNGTTSYLTLNEQEWQLGGDVDRGKTSAVSNTLEGILKSALTSLPDPSLAVLSVQVIATGACASANGSVISVPGLPAPDAGASDGGPAPSLEYFSGGFPAASATSVVNNGETPSAIIWNMPVNASFKDVTVTPPAGCTVKAFPTTDPSDSGPGANLTYTGNVTLVRSGDDAGGNYASFMRVFLQ